MKTVSVREMKAKWSEIEKQVANGETFEVLNRGKPTVRLIPATPRKVIVWDDHLATAVKVQGSSSEELIRANREGKG